MWTLIIKGSPDVALAEAKKRGIEPVEAEDLFHLNRAPWSETRMKVAKGQPTENRVRAWFNEDRGRAPFPEGTLLGFW